MLYYDRIEISERIDPTKSINPILTGGGGGGGTITALPPPMRIFFNYSGTANAAELKFPNF